MNARRLPFPRLGLALVLVSVACGEPDAETTPSGAHRLFPNVALIVIDTLRADALGAYGQSAPTSPEIDDFARNGVRFARTVAQSTWTRPSIGSMLTSLHPRTLGIYHERGDTLAGHYVTLAEILHDNGYRTLGATANPNINAYFNFDQGFDVYMDSERVFRFMPRGDGPALTTPEKAILPKAGASILVNLENAVRSGSERPVYVQVNLMEVHDHSRIEPPKGEIYDVLSHVDPAPGKVSYLKAVRLLSYEVGAFLRNLKRLPGWNDALFVITSDHGESLADEHPGIARPMWHGYLVYESQALVPLILYSPGGDLPSGRVIERPVRLLDLAPTVLDYAGIPVPETMAGRSLMPLVRDPASDDDLPERYVVETEFRKSDKSAVYAGEWIYIENADGHPGTRPRELQRAGVPADGARTDVSEQHESVLEENAAYLEKWRELHPRARPTRAVDVPPEETVEHLKALGYVQ